MAGNKPDLRVSIKPVDGEEIVDVFAYWRRDNGKLGGSLDRRVKGVRVYMEDGSVHTVKRLPDGKRHTHWINAQESEAPRAQHRETRAGDAPHANDFPPDDFGDDDSGIPF